MIRKYFNIFTKKEINIISKSITNIKINHYKLHKNFYSYDVVKNNNIKKIHQNIILPNVKNFNINNKIYNLKLDENYLEWKNTKDCLEYEENLIHAVICNDEIDYDFFIFNKEKDILKPSELLIFDSEVAIKFYNHNKADLIFFTYSNYLKEEITVKYEDKFCGVG